MLRAPAITSGSFRKQKAAQLRGFSIGEAFCLISG
jgi:hypothetical protein